MLSSQWRRRRNRAAYVWGYLWGALPWLPVAVEIKVEDEYDLVVRADLPNHSTRVELLLRSEDVGRGRGRVEYSAARVLQEALIYSAHPGTGCRGRRPKREADGVTFTTTVGWSASASWDVAITKAWRDRDVELYEALRWGREHPWPGGLPVHRELVRMAYRLERDGVRA